MEQERFLLKISTNLFIVSDYEGAVSYASPKAVLLFGFSDIKDARLSSCLSRENWQELRRHISDVLLTKIPGYFTLRHQNRFFNVYIYSHNGKAAQCWEDITERRQLSRSLHRTSERLEFAEKTTGLGYWELDIKARKLYWSAQMYRLFGLDARSVSHKRNIIRDRILPEDYPLYHQKLHELVHSGKPVDGILRLRRSDDAVIYCTFKAAMLREGERNKIAGTFQDITKLIEMQKDLEKARRSAEASDRSKSYFLAQASHDLRQPMQALRIFISTLEEEPLDNRQKELLGKISASADNLNNLLDNLLDISKLDSEGFEACLGNFDISDLLKNIFFEFHEIARSRGIHFHTSLCHYTVSSDALLVERVIRNLLSNAFKYTRSKVLLGCKRENDRIRVLVMDNGEGITAEEKERIFDEFYQSRNINDNSRSGAGLGLSIVRRISDILGLDISVDSRPGRGSSFSFLLPLEKVLKKPRTGLLHLIGIIMICTYNFINIFQLFFRKLHQTLFPNKCVANTFSLCGKLKKTAIIITIDQPGVVSVADTPLKHAVTLIP